MLILMWASILYWRYLWWLRKHSGLDWPYKLYLTYLQSRAWQRVRLKVLKRAGYKCEKCGYAGKLEIHHLTYANLGWERLKELMALCAICHTKEHHDEYTRLVQARSQIKVH